MNETDNTFEILESSRFWIQRVLVPIVVCIGVIGNTVTVMVLTRRRMRSSTNIYLSALAIADIIHNLFVLVLSFKHYPNIHDRKYELYWRFFGLTHWLCDAASSTSVWLTVSFTIERYIAVCHPIKGKVLCTENRAKSIIALVYIFCLLTTASTTFEHQLTLEEKCIKECPLAKVKKTHHPSGNILTHNGTTTIHIQHHNLDTLNHDHPNLKILNDMVIKSILANCSQHHSHIILGPIYLNSSSSRFETINLTENIAENQLGSSSLQQTNMVQDNATLLKDIPSIKNDTVNATECCLKKYTIDTENTNLGNNITYTTFISWYSAIFFAILPLIVIGTFNCFLIRAVYYSQKTRKAMTTSQENISISNENRITLMLIGVVLMFLICQTPTAVYLMYTNIHEPQSRRAINIQLIAGNIFNFLLNLNASSNFLLYCVLSKKFRGTFKKIFCERKKKQQDTIVLSNRSSQKFNPYKHGIRRNASEYHTPRNLETQSLTGIPRSKSLMMRPAGRAQSSDLIV